MNAWGITIILLWTISVNGQNTFVRILEQGEIKGLERTEGDNFLIAGTKRGREQDLFIAPRRYFCISIDFRIRSRPVFETH